MKISCQSCQAKYTIADEKVLGKIVKIRCKKCGATIVINGNEGATAIAGEGPHSQGALYDAGAAVDSWTVNVADGDQRTMTTQELVDAFHQGVVTEETFCWKDGMGDWLPMREIEQLASAAGVGGAAGQSPDQTQEEQHQPDAGMGGGMGMGGFDPPPPPSAPTQQQDQGVFPGYGNGGLAAASGNGNGANGGLFGSSPPPAAARRQGGRGGAGADLFGSVAKAGGEDEVMTSAPAAGATAEVGDGKLTGQRNENSVLFSLNALTSSGPKEEAAPQVGEGSGLIDIRALSASMSGDGSNKKNHVDDIMNLGGGGAFSAALAAPVLSPSSMDSGLHDVGGGRKDNTKMILIGIIAAGALIALSIVLVFVLRKPAEPQVTAPVGTMPAPTDTTTAAAAAPAASASVAAADTSTPPSGAAAPGTGQAPSGAAPRKTGGGGGGAAGPFAGGGGGNKGGGGGSSPPPFVAPPAPKGGGGGSFDDAIAKSVNGGGGGGAPAPAPASTASFDRGAASAALSSVNVNSCKKGDGPTGSGHIKITFANNGTVQSAVVDQPPFAGTSVGGCVASKFRGAHVPGFAGAPMTVGKSFVVE